MGNRGLYLTFVLVYICRTFLEGHTENVTHSPGGWERGAGREGAFPSYYELFMVDLDWFLTELLI